MCLFMPLTCRLSKEYLRKIIFSDIIRMEMPCSAVSVFHMLTIPANRYAINIYVTGLRLNRKFLNSERKVYQDTLDIFQSCLSLGVLMHPELVRLRVELDNQSSREGPKSAPYLRLKNSKIISKCQVFPSTVPS